MICEYENKKLINRFLEYVKIPSESGSEKEVCDKLFQDLTELNLSPEKHFENLDNETNGYNIYAYLEGDEDADSIILNGHLDTVTPGKNINPIIEDGYIKSAGNTILGADDKTSIAVILSAVETILEKNINHRSIELLFTVGEECGLKGIQAFDKSKLRSKIAFSIDNGNPVGGIVMSTPSYAKIKIRVMGKSVHAGNAPEDGISAIQVASKAIANIPLLRVDKDTTCNVGTFKSEFPDNVVPDEAIISMEIRSFSEGKLQEQIEKIEKCFENACDDSGADFEFETHKIYSSYKKTNENISVQMAKNAMTDLGINPIDFEVCGGSDAHVLNGYGIDAINLSCGNENIHSLDEKISLKSLYADYNLVLKLCGVSL